ncbi:MAG: chromosome segregation SMC family protein [archaeon]
MAHLISLAIKSFKSFGRLTTMNFSEKLTGIVGPNGSGKSNIMDAIFFVIGSSRITAMRAKRGGELIFNSKTIKPEYAEVRLVISNSEREFGEDWGAALTISRRVRGDGLSAYRVNGRRMTRFQVVDILAKAKVFPDGHNIVQQGEIAGLVKKNSDERRQIIEELAGIREYDEKKHKAFLELAVVEQKVNEINGLLRERQRNLERLKKEREQAARFGKLLEVRKLFEDSIVKRRLEEREESRQKLLGERESEEKGLASVDAQLSECSAKVDGEKKELSAVDRKLSQLQSGENLKIVKESERISGSLQAKTARAAQIDEQVLSGKKRREAILSKEIPELEAQLSKRRARVEEIQGEISQLEAEISAAEKSRLELLSVFSRESEAQNRHEEARKGFEDVLAKLSAEERKGTFELERLASLASRLEEEREYSEKGLSELRRRNAERVAEAGKLEKKQADAIARARKLSQELSEIKVALSEATALHSEKVSKVSLISGKLGEVSSSERDRVPDLAAKFPGFLGRLSSFIKRGTTPQKIGLLGTSLLPNSVVVSDRKTALEIAEYVKREGGFGRLSILILGEGAPSTREAEQLEKLVPFSDRRISAALSSFVLPKGRKIVPSLREALEDGNALTEDGEIVSVNGRIVEVGEIVLRETIEAELSSERELLEAAQARRDSIEKRALELSSEIASIESEGARISSEIAKRSPGKLDLAEENRLSEKIEASETERNKALSEKERILSELARTRELRALEEKKLSEITPPARKSDFDFSRIKKSEEAHAALRKRHSEGSLDVSENNLRIKNYLVPEIESLGRLVKSLEKEEEKLLSEKEKLGKETAELRTQAEEFDKLVQEKLKDLKDEAARKESMAKELEKDERKKYEFLARKSAVESKISLFSIRIEGEDKEIAELSVQISGRLKFIPGTVKKLSAKLSVISDRIARLGAINQRALLEFEEAEVEFKDVEVKKTKLEEERQSILTFMEAVETRKKEVFMEHYNSIAENFAKIYSRLSGGMGELSLENPESVFEGGLIIVAKPPGKEVSRIDLLSGGEQTIAALAFIFSIQEHSPAPFYIFDEVDAALDKENSEKLAALLSTYSAKSQIIVITHNDNVMKDCDQLVGVYLNKQEGISRIISQPTPEFLKKVSREIQRGQAPE